MSKGKEHQYTRHVKRYHKEKKGNVQDHSKVGLVSHGLVTARSAGDLARSRGKADVYVSRHLWSTTRKHNCGTVGGEGHGYSESSKVEGFHFDK